MEESELDRVRAFAKDTLKETYAKLAELDARLLEDEAHQAYAEELDAMTDSEAIEHLRSVDESRVVAAYLILSNRLEPGVLADVCLGSMARDGEKSRLTGAIGVGSCLKGTFDARASRALAIMVRDRHELTHIREAACRSLILINRGPTPAPREEGFEPGEPDSEVSGVDWAFVDSFIP